ncbi:MAG: NUDIX hydrolase [Myxococcaceae bacterium]
MPAPWKRLRTHRENDYTILTIREDIVQDPRSLTEHPRVVIQCPSWVNVVALTPALEVIMVKQWRVGVRENTLEVPGGMVDGGEAPAQAALRELEEETGHRAKRLTELGWVHPNPAIQTNRAWTFLAEDCFHVHDGNPDPGEDLLVERVPIGEIPKLIRAAQITHALTVSAFYLYDARKSEPHKT